MTHLFDKSARTAINHQNKRFLPFFHHTVRIVFATGVSLLRVDGITQLVVSVVNILCDRSTVWWDSEKGLSVIVSLRFEKIVGDLSNSKAKIKQENMRKDAKQTTKIRNPI